MIAYVSKKYPENFTFQLFTSLQYFTREIYYFHKKVAFFLTVSVVFSVFKLLRFNNVKLEWL